MKSVIRYQSQLLYRRSYKPVRTIRVRPAAKLTLTFRPIKLDLKRRFT
jgi:hypothetical protein